MCVRAWKYTQYRINEQLILTTADLYTKTPELESIIFLYLSILTVQIYYKSKRLCLKKLALVLLNSNNFFVRYLHIL